MLLCCFCLSVFFVFLRVANVWSQTDCVPVEFCFFLVQFLCGNALKTHQSVSTSTLSALKWGLSSEFTGFSTAD